MRGLEPRFQKSGGSDHSPKISRLRAISVISVPDLALADRACVLEIQNSGHKAQNTRDKGNLIFYFINGCEGPLCLKVNKLRQARGKEREIIFHYQFGLSQKSVT